MHPEPAESKQPNAMRMWWEYRKLWFLEWLRAIHPSARENMLAGAGTTIGVIIGIKVGLYQQHKLLLLLCGVAGYGVIFLVYSIVHASTTSAKL